MVWLGAQRGMDFAVFWRAARAFWDGSDPYRIRPEWGGFVFKYPPWILPIMAPLGFFSESVARALFGVLNFGLLIDCVRRLLRAGVRPWPLLVSLLAMHAIFLEHFFAGQFTLALTWALLTKTAWGPVLASAKVFPLISVVGYKRSRWRRTAGVAGGSILLLSAVAVLMCGPGIFADWLSAANSGAAELGESIIRGPGNHSFVNFWGRLLGVSPLRHPLFDPLLGAGVAAGGAWVLWRRQVQSIAAWIALGLLASPLGWVHSYVMAFPLLAENLSHAYGEGGTKGQRALAVTSLLLVGFFVPQFATTPVTTYTDLAGFKASGVLLALVLSVVH